MFEGKGDKKKNIISKSNDTGTTVISQGVFIEGHSFKGVGTIRIDGVYTGEMFVDGHVIVGPTGEIKGNITTTSMLIAGTVSGNILCKDEVHFAETAVIDGDIQTSVIIIDHGAEINGSLSTRKKTLNEPIDLDAAVKTISSPVRRNPDKNEERRRNIEPIDERVGFYK